MYSKDQSSQLKQAFWTTFGQYISPQLSSEGLKINWINYKTGLKYLHFKMHADQRKAWVGIEISHPDAGMQELVFEQFLEFKKILSDYINEDWTWELHIADDYGKTVSRIYAQLDGVNIFRREDWPALISFLKPRLIALDEFWGDVKYSFDLFK